MSLLGKPQILLHWPHYSHAFAGKEKNSEKGFKLIISSFNNLATFSLSCFIKISS
jgi:hypothetical protein